MSRLLVHEHKVPEVIVCRLCLWHFIVWFWLDSMHNINKLDAVLNEEDWNVISNNIPITFIGVEFNGKPSHVTNSISASSTALYSGKTQENRGGPGGICQNSGG